MIEESDKERGEEEAYQSSRLRLDEDEVGIMPDTGARDNLGGSVDAGRQAAAAAAAGREARIKQSP